MNRDRENLPKELLKDRCQLKTVPIICIDCNLKFDWYVGTLRCEKCYKANRSKKYYKASENVDRRTLVLINSKCKILTKVNKSVDIKNWFLANTKIVKEKLENTQSIRHNIKKAKSVGRLGIKFICYWIMLEKDYSFDSAIKLINSRHTCFGKKRKIVKSEDYVNKVLAIYNSTGLQKDVAKEFGVHRSAVNHIKIGYRDSDITGKIYQKRYGKISTND